MSAVIAVPELMDQAAMDLATIADTLNAAHMTAASATTQVLPAAADEVSTSIAHLFSGYGQEYQKLAAEATASYEQFAQHLTASAGAYASAEDAIAAFVEDFSNWVNLLSASATPLLPLLYLFENLTIIASFIAVAIPIVAVGLPLSLAALTLGIPVLAAFVGIVVGAFLLAPLLEPLAAL